MPTSSTRADPAPRRLRRDVASAYGATLARIGAWAGVSAIVFRRLGPEPFALIALVRATVGLLAYTSIGLGPALVRALAHADAAEETIGDRVTAPRVYSSGVWLARASGVVGCALVLVYAHWFTTIHKTPESLHRQAAWLALGFGLGMVARLMSEAPGSLLQVRGRLTLDNGLLAMTDLLWLVASIALLDATTLGAAGVGLAFALANAGLLAARSACARGVARRAGPGGTRFDRVIVAGLLAFGAGVALAQAADFLYAPTDYILINRLLSPGTVANYAPAVQIDAGLLLMVTGLAAALFPHSAVAHAAGDRAAVRRYYARGTLASLAVLIPAALAVYLAAPALLRAWLGAPMPATLAILPLVLVHTVVGGSSAVGRSVLLAMGKVKPFTVAVLVAGVANVGLSWALVHFGRLGLRGIVYGTVIAVVGRCALWMPWYVRRSLRAGDSIPPGLVG